MKILVVGAGATGGYFGAALARAGRDVSFLVREKRAQFLQERGLRIVDAEGETRSAPRILTAGTLDEIFDVVLVTVKGPGLEQAMVDMTPAVGPDTLIVPFLNGMGHMEVLATAFGADAVIGSVVHLVSTINADGDIAILNPLARWSIGDQDGPLEGAVSARVQALLAEISVPGFEAVAVPNGLAIMWHKWVFIVAAGVTTCLMRGPVGSIAAVPGGPEFVAAVLAQTAAVSAAAGYPVPQAQQAGNLTFLTEPGSTFTSSLYRDVTAGLAHEGEQIVGDFARRAAGLGVPVPLIDLALLQLRVNEASRS